MWTRTIQIVLLAMVLAVTPLGAMAQDPVGDLVQQVTREFDILAPSLMKTAEKMLDEAREVNRRAEPFYEWNDRERESKPFLKEGDDEVTWLQTLRVHAVTATRREFEYRIDGIDRIERTGKRDMPFKGVVDIQVTVHIRSAEATRREPIEVPAEYKPAPLEWDESGELIYSPSDAEDWDDSSVSYLPIPNANDTPRPFLKSAPQMVKDALEPLAQDLKKAKPVPSERYSGHESATFYLDAKTKTWRYSR